MIAKLTDHGFEWIEKPELKRDCEKDILAYAIVDADPQEREAMGIVASVTHEGLLYEKQDADLYLAFQQIVKERVYENLHLISDFTEVSTSCILQQLWGDDTVLHFKGGSTT